MQVNEKRLEPAAERDEMRLLQKADVVWAKMTLAPNEVLFIKVSKHLAEFQSDIGKMVGECFKGKEDKVIVFVEGDIEVTKVAAQ